MAESSYLYLRSMKQVPDTNPDVCNVFINGHHIVRWSDRTEQEYLSILP